MCVPRARANGGRDEKSDPGNKMPPKTRGSSRGGLRVGQIHASKNKMPREPGGALGADEAEPGEGFDSGGSLREVSEPGTPLRASEALDGVVRGKFKFFSYAGSEIVHAPRQE